MIGAVAVWNRVQHDDIITWKWFQNYWLLGRGIGLTHWSRDKMAATWADNIFQCNCINEKILILIKMSLKIVPKVWINNIPALVQIMAWHRPGIKPVSKPVMVDLLMNICVTQTQWVKHILPTIGVNRLSWRIHMIEFPLQRIHNTRFGCFFVVSLNRLLNSYSFNILRPGQNGCHFQDDIFKCIFLNENV